ncbi:acyltransferase family protein [Phascolarctobacterium sp.]|uniref:acyltransferase family protein n=2 Tax=Phascolarctobacterium sp. TaxID=2049039 RepID=UPI003869ADD7
MSSNVTTKPKSKRIDELDMAKGIAIFSVVLIHLSEVAGVNVHNQKLFFLFTLMTEVTMGMFFLCSGYVFKMKGSVMEEITKRFKQIMLPYYKTILIITAMYYPMYVMTSKIDLSVYIDKSISNLLAIVNYSVLQGKIDVNILCYGYVPLWFMVEIFMAFCLLMPVASYLKDKGITTHLVAMAAFLGMAMLMTVYDPQGNLANTYNSTTSFYFVGINIFGFAGLLLLGHILKKFSFFELDAQSNSYIYGMFAASVIVYFGVYSQYSWMGYAMQFGRWGQYGCWSILVTSIAAIAFTYMLVCICRVLTKAAAVKDVLLFLGTNTLTILLWHYFTAELIANLGGFWRPVYFTPVPAEEYSFTRFVWLVAATLATITAYIKVKDHMALKKA